MPLSTAAKITLVVVAGAATVTGVGYAMSRSRKGDKGKLTPDDTKPSDDEQEVVELSIDDLLEADEGPNPVSVGVRYEIPLGEAGLAEGMTISSVRLGKVVAGETLGEKAWSVDAQSFDVSHQDIHVGFDSESKRISVTINRAGVYAVDFTYRGADGEDYSGDGLLFSATKLPRGKDDAPSPEDDGASTPGDDPGSIPRDDGSRPSDDEREVVEIELKDLDDIYRVNVGPRYEIPLPAEIIAELGERRAGGRRIAKVEVRRIITGDSRVLKAWSLTRSGSRSFDLSHDDIRITFDIRTGRLSVTIDRAGFYEFFLQDQFGNDVVNPLAFRATSPAAA